MFRSGPLTRNRLNQIMRRAEATPHNLKVVAKACLILPQDLLAWFAAGQDPKCRDPLMVELAWKINELRADVAARNYARIEAAASGGKKTKEVTENDGTKQVTVEDVLPAAWAIDRIDTLAAASHWEVSPDADQLEELHQMMGALAPTPLLTSGVPEVEVADGVDDVAQGDLVKEGAKLVIGNVPGQGIHESDEVGEKSVVVHDQTLTGPE